MLRVGHAEEAPRAMIQHGAVTPQRSEDMRLGPINRLPNETRRIAPGVRYSMAEPAAGNRSMSTEGMGAVFEVARDEGPDMEEPPPAYVAVEGGKTGQVGGRRGVDA